MKNWMYNRFMPQYLKGFYFKYLGLLTLTKLWFYLLVNSLTSSFKKSNSLTFWMSISQYSICSSSILLSFPLTFYHFYSFQTIFIFYFPSANLASILFDFFSDFSFHYSLKEVPSLSGFLCAFSWSWEMYLSDK